jgi:hypothetical protein
MNQPALKADEKSALIPPAAPKPRGAVALPPSAKTPEDTVIFKVRDVLATNGPRTHELLDSRGIVHKYVFPNDRDSIDIPMSMAASLIGNEGFIVQNQEGRELRAVRRETQGANRGVILSFDETVAKYEELTQDALLARCKKLKLSVNKSTPKPELISVLMEASLILEEQDAASDDSDDTDIEEEDEYH